MGKTKDQEKEGDKDQEKEDDKDREKEDDKDQEKEDKKVEDGHDGSTSKLYSMGDWKLQAMPSIMPNLITASVFAMSMGGLVVVAHRFVRRTTEQEVEPLIQHDIEADMNE